MFLGFPCGSASKGSACNARDLGPIPGLGRSPGEGKGYPLQYSGLENSMDPHGVAKSWTHFHFTLHTIWTLLFPITEYLSYHFFFFSIWGKKNSKTVRDGSRDHLVGATQSMVQGPVESTTIPVCGN